MNISVRWLNEYLTPGNITPEAAERVLTDVGFPIESITPVGEGENADTLLDVEVTSNRGDCLSHVGLAREIAAASGRRLKLPAVRAMNPGPGEAGKVVSLDNRVSATGQCPLFTLRVIKGVKVGPSPAWLVRALESVGKRSINNVVDVTNYVAGEFGQPSHVFDLKTIAKGTPPHEGKPRVIVRTAAKGEKLTLLDDRVVELGEADVVIADATRAISLAGIMGGKETEVTSATTDVLLEVATWSPLAVRTTARRLGIRTEASHRYERWVDPRSIDVPARRAAGLIAELCGGTLVDGWVTAGSEMYPTKPIMLRAARCRGVLGANVTSAEMTKVLRAHEVEVSVEAVSGAVGGVAGGGSADGDDVILRCVPPGWRPDLTREIDLIEEVARTHGLDRVPVKETVRVRVAAPQGRESADRAIAHTLAGLGFYEAVTFSFVSRKAAAPALEKDTRTLEVVDERRKGDPVLRPSIVPSLLACRRANQDRGVWGDGGEGGGGVRLFETASVFWQAGGASGPGEQGAAKLDAHREAVRLAMVADAVGVPGAASPGAHERRQLGVRLVKGALERVAAATGGNKARLELVPDDSAPELYERGAAGRVRLVMRDGGARRDIGWAGLVSAKTQAAYDLAAPVAAAEVDLEPLEALWPPAAKVEALPSFPDIERDLSLIVDEGEAWERIERLVHAAEPALLERVEFVGVYRGPQAGAGKKSVTLRMRFRDAARTLRREEVDPQVAAIVALAKREMGAAVRTA
jgi:phenylalanyl-tRNA synthetase beta chain